LTEIERIHELPKQIVASLSRVDVLINNAAFTGSSRISGWSVPPLEQEEGAWRAAMELNLTAPFRLIQLFAPALRASGHGVVVNIASIYGMVGPQFSLYADTGMGNPAAYNASKAGLLQLTRYFATALAPHVRVNAISPGGISRGQPEAFVQRYCERTPLGRMAEEGDFEGGIAYLCSDLSRYVTGHNLVIDGGWTIW
jgi:NAD(P)-dependent dehydrogenase (short-subunit alcohol dehydrogenase family)